VSACVCTALSRSIPDLFSCYGSMFSLLDDTFKTDDSLYAAYGNADGLAGAMKSLNPLANSAGGPMLDGQKLVGWPHYHQVSSATTAVLPHYLSH